ncbi:nitrite/Sulfite reductase ferredoxin-like half domain protein [[Clostridium] sordellii ATCC 9714]|nr:nitrite/Sulfite reductase ferredoxin-like half domain protein [[Clostridium] sordellii ATCC 9714] [Paeniclostridium sordellii ATCC 9714]
MSSGLTYDEKMNFKKMGILAQKQNGYYTIRFLSKVGYFEADEIVALSNIAKKYGNGEVSLTSRLTVEIPYIEEKI